MVATGQERADPSLSPGQTPPEPLGHALWSLARHPWRTLITGWNWKAALLSALVRATLFATTNLHGGRRGAIKAALVEGLFAISIAGLLAATTQRLRRAVPVWQTAAVVALGLPTLLVLLQAGVHTLAGTRHLRTGLIGSFLMASVASAFNWFAQRQGALLAGPGPRAPLAQDVQRLPALIAAFLLAAPRAVGQALRSRSS